MIKHRLTLTHKELGILAHIMRQLCDYAAGDDRPDHGLNNLKGYRNLPTDDKWDIYNMTGRINRLYYRTKKQELTGKGEGDVI